MRILSELPAVPGRSPAALPGTVSGAARAVRGGLALFIAALGVVAALAPRGMAAWMAGLLLLAGLALALAPAARFRRAPAGPAPVALRATLKSVALRATLALVLLTAASVAWSPSPRAAQTALEVALLALAAWTAGGWIGTLEAGEADRLGSLFLIGLGIGAALFAAEYSLGFPMNRLVNGLVHGMPPSFVPLSNNVPKRAMGLLTALLWPAALLVRRRHGDRAALLLIGGAALALLAQPSRSAALGALVGLAVFLAARRWPAAVRRALMVALLAAGIGAVPAALALRDAGADRSALLFHSAQHRVEIWGRAAARSAEAPWFGHGIDASRALKPAGETSRFEALDTTLLPLHPHNAFLQIWLELGAAGMAPVLALGLLALAATRRLAPDGQPFALAFLASALSMASTAYGLWQAWWLAGLLTAGLLLRLAARAPKRAP